MSVLLLLAVVTGPPDAVIGDALAPYRGQPVLSVDLEAPEDEDVVELRSLIDIHPGYLLSTDAVQAALKRLYALGRFSDVGVTAERLSGTVSLHFYVKAIRRLDVLEIIGRERSDEDALRAALELEPGAEVDSRTAESLKERAQQHLLRAGFPDAEVAVEQSSEADSPLVSFVLGLTEGEPMRVARVRFVGRPRLERQGLLDQIETRAGGILNLITVDADTKALRKAYRDHGFLESIVKKPQVVVDADGATVSFAIQAGDRVYVELHGNRLLTKSDLMALWPSTTGALNPTDLAVFAQRIADTFRRLGHFAAEVEFETQRDRAAEVTRHHVRVTEGAAHRVVRLEFVGAKAFQPKLLQAQLRSFLDRELGSEEELTERLRASDTCLAEPRGLSHPTLPERSCPRPVVAIADRWIPDLYEDALEEIAAAYRGLGFLSAQVGPAEPTLREDHTIAVRVPIDEGPQAFIESVSFRGNQAFDASELLTAVEEATTSTDSAELPQRPGSPYSANGIEDARIETLRRYRDRGHLYATAFAEVVKSEDGRRVDVVFRIEEGPQVRIERILVRGNRYTLDSLIRSRTTMQPGDLYRLDQALADQRSIAALGVFSSVRVRIIDEEKPAERKDVVAEVVERPRTLFDLKGGISTADGVRAGFGLAHKNVFGTASTVSTSAAFNRQLFFGLYGQYNERMSTRYANFSALDQLEREIRVGLQSPRLKTVIFDPLARIDLVHERENAISFSLNSWSTILGLDFTTAEHVTVSLEPQVSYTDLACIIDTGEVVGEDECAEEVQRTNIGGKPRIDVGERTTFKVGPSVTFDYRDNPFNPTRGFYANLKGSYAVGTRKTVKKTGDIPPTQPELDANAAIEESPFAFTKVEATISGYLPANKLVFAASARAGVISLIGDNPANDVPIDERFFMGGRATLRGFPEGGTLIPEDACVYYDGAADPCVDTPNGKRLSRTIATPPVTPGGEFFLLFKVEARIPMTWFSENLSTGLFVDFGNLWIDIPAVRQLAFRVGAGAGIRYATPVGPLALDIGINTAPDVDAGEINDPVIHFSVGVF